MVGAFAGIDEILRNRDPRIYRGLFIASAVWASIGVGMAFTDWLWTSGRAPEVQYTHGLRMHYWREEQPK